MADDSAAAADNADPSPVADPQSVEGLFVAALGHATADEREAFLNEACGDDAERRMRVEALLRAYDDAGSFLEKPPVGASSSATVSLDFLTPTDDPGLLGMLGPYEVYEVLGRGGMGIVFRARDPKLNRVVAIKVLAPELAANPNARRRFLREAQAAAAISHPHVVTIHAVDEGSAASSTPAAGSSRGASSLPFIVMECIVGQTLQQKLDKQGSLRLTETLRIGHQLACGLAAAHKQGLIHRDIKPANVLLENSIERVKITDFGLARAADDVSITRTGEVSGTPQYMSPEQATGETVDHRSDLFSLGCVLYAMCTGRSPFRATTLAAAIRRVCDDTPRPIEEINPEVPPWLIDIVNRLLEKNPDERLQSAEDVERLLADRLAGVQQPAASRPTSPHRSASKPVSITERAVESDDWVRVSRVLIAFGTLLLLGVFLAFISIAFDLLRIGPRFVRDFGTTVVPVFVFACGLFLVGLILRLGSRSRQGVAESGEGPLRASSRNRGPHQRGAHADPSDAPTMPSWLVTPLPGPVKLIAVVVYAAACLVMGQGIEQWSDVSGAAGVNLIVAALVLGALALLLPKAAGVQFTRLHRLTFGLGALPLMFLGAQVPDREFKRRLAAEPDLVALATVALGAVGLLIIVALLRYSRRPSANVALHSPASPWRVLGWMIVGGIVLIPVAFITMLVFPYLAQERSDLAQERTNDGVVQATVNTSAAESMRLAQSKSDVGVVEVHFDDARPLVRITAEQDIDLPPHQERPTFRYEEVTSNPFSFDLPTGVYTLVIAFHDAAGQTGVFAADVNVAPGKTAVFDVRGNATYRLSKLRPTSGEVDRVAVDVWIEDTGLTVHFDEMPSGVGKGLLNESGSIFMNPGRYRVMVEDGLAGWHKKSKFGETEPVRYEYETIDVESDADVHVTRNFHKMAAGNPPLLPGIHSFRWNGESFDLSQAQAVAVQRLLLAYARSEQDVHEGVLLSNATFRGNRLIEEPMTQREADEYLQRMTSEGHSLKEMFDDGQHPAWGTLVVEGENSHMYRLPELKADDLVKPPEPEGTGTTVPSSIPPVVVGSLTPGQGDRSGDLIIEIKDDGFLVAVRRKSAFDGYVPGSEQQVTEFGWTHLRVHPGEHEILTRDLLFGVVPDSTYTQTGDLRWPTQTVTVAESRAASVTVRRDLQRESDQINHIVNLAGAFLDLKLKVLWDGESHLYSPGQAFVVGQLMKAFAAGTPEMSETALLESWPSPDPERAVPEPIPRPDSIKSLFDEGEHAAWGTVIVPGEADGTYRLTPLDRGSIDVTDFAKEMVVTIERVEPDRRFTRRQLFTAAELAVPPGEYRYTVDDDFVGWGQWQPDSDGFFGGRVNHTRTGTVSVLTGEAMTIQADRRFTDYLNPPQPTESSRSIAFMWYPDYEPHHLRPHVMGVRLSSSSPDNGIDNFKVSQFHVLLKLLQAFAMSEPEVSESELLQQATVEAASWSDVFPEDERGYGGRWRTFIVPGETDATWRLKPPPSGERGT